MRNADNDVSAALTDQQSGTTAQHLIVTADSFQANISLIAPTEGRTRFIAGSPAITTEPQRGMPGALSRLASQCGYALSAEMASAAVIAGPPVQVQVVGERGEDDMAALEIAERFGVARIVGEPVTPSRPHARGHSWYQSVTRAWRDGQTEVLLIILPPGALPLWAADVLTALNETPPAGDARCLVLASDTDLAMALPPDTILFLRGDHLAQELTGALNRIRATRCLRWLPNEIPLLSRLEALIAAMRAISTERSRPSIYLDVGDGTTAIIADESATDVYHDPEIDGARGAIRLLRRCDTEQFTRLIPFTLGENTLRTWALRRISWPMAFLTDAEDRAIAAAFAHMAIRLVLGSAIGRIPDNALWILGPSLARLGSSATVLRMVADLMPSIRLAVVVCDSDDLIAATGALAIPYPGDVSSLLAHDALITVGSVVQAPMPGGRASNPITAMLTDDYRTRATDVTANSLTTITCDGPATLRLKGWETGIIQIAVDGGAGGVLVDTRRRPLAAVTPQASRPNVSGRLRPSTIANGASNDS